MGIVQMGPPQELILLLREKFRVPNFVETGTFRGGTALWAARHFPHVITIEGSESIHRDVQSTLGALENVESLLGDSRQVLPDVLRRLNGEAIFWLDSHWCGVDSFGADDQCPLLDEVAALQHFAHASYVLIDDARLFLSPPPLPNRREQWPAIDEVIQALRRLDPHAYIVIFDDAIVSVPAAARDAVANHVQRLNTERWQSHGGGQSSGVWGRLKKLVAS